MNNDKKIKLNEEQTATAKVVFLFFCGLAVFFSWMMYWSWTRNGSWYILWTGLYFYNCNIATQLRDIIKWPFYSQDT